MELKNVEIRTKDILCPNPSCRRLIGQYDPQKGVNAVFFCKNCKKEYTIRKTPAKNP